MFSCCSSGKAPRKFEYLIIGGGTAAGYACHGFVEQGLPQGKLGMVMAEPMVPYERPALTKECLLPPGSRTRAPLPGYTCEAGGGKPQDPAWYESHGIELIRGKATAVDLQAHTVRVGDAEYAYGKLILATGCMAVRAGKFGVKGDDLPNVFYIREERDVAKLVEALQLLGSQAQVVVLGGGYIGMECAAALTGWGCGVTMVFPEAHCMPRLFNTALATWVEEQYRARGVRILAGDVAEELVGGAGGVVGVRVKSGNILECDLVIVGIGATPNVDCCTGLIMEKGGFAVDGHMQTSDPDVYAVGDVCTFPSRDGNPIRCEHVDHARRSAAQAVKAAMGREPEVYDYLPHLCSRVFEHAEAPLAFDFFGDPSGQRMVFQRDDGSIGALWVEDGQVTGALLMGSPGPSAAEKAKLRGLVLLAPSVDASPAELFARASL